MSAAPTLQAQARCEPTGRKRLVMVGNGMAGARTMEEILQRGGAGLFDITMFGDEPYGNYNRILLSNVLAGSEDTKEIFLNPLAWYAENEITLHSGSRITEIDRWAKKVFAEDGTAVSYDKLIVATGSRSFFPPIDGLMAADGSRKAGIFGFRTIDDCNEMTSYAAGHRRVAVVGGGLLGLEAARGMLNRGLEVHVIHQSPYLMNQQLDAQGAAVLKTTIEKLGVHVHLGASTVAVSGEDAVSGLVFADGTSLDCDMVIVACGIRPNSELAARGGLTVERAIVVDDQMRSVDDPDIYAVGECAQRRGQVYGLVAPLWEQAKVLADHVTAGNPDAEYRGSKLATKLKVMGVELAVMGVKAPEHDDDEFLQFSEPSRGVYKTIVVRDGKLIGAALLGDLSKVSFLTQAFDRGTPLPPERLTLMFDIGTPSAVVGVEELADDAQACNCNGVSKGAIAACVASGTRTVKGVMEATRAGTGCGACKDLVGQIVDWASGGGAEADPSAHYYVPGVPLSKPELIDAGERCTSRQSRPCSPRWQGGSRMRGARSAWLRCSRCCGGPSTRTSATPGSSTTACTPTSRTTGRSRWCHRAVVVDDADGIAERLDAAIQLSVDAYVDPWQEGQAPVTQPRSTDLVGGRASRVSA